MSLTRSGVPFLVRMTVCSMSCDVIDQPDFADVDLLQALLNETAAGIGVVVGELLLDLGEAQAVGDQFVGIDADLIFAGGAAEAGDVDDIGNGFEIFFDDPVFERLQFHRRHTAGLELCRVKK